MATSFTAQIDDVIAEVIGQFGHNQRGTRRHHAAKISPLACGSLLYNSHSPALSAELYELSFPSACGFYQY